MPTKPEASATPAIAAPRIFTTSVTRGLTLLGLVAAVYAVTAGTAQAMPGMARAFLVAWLAIAAGVTWFVTPRNFVAGYLVGLLALLIGWRIAALHGVTLVVVPLGAAFVAFLLQFAATVRANPHALTPAEWQLTFVRIYIGFDMVPHCTEKLFAGPGPFLADVEAFAAMGVPSPGAFVVLGGLCELGIAIGIGCGLLTRLAAVGAALYFLIATLIGGHFGNGFIWASSGGGWEYPVLMIVLYLTFAWRGAGAFALDGVLRDRGMLSPRLLRLAAPAPVLPPGGATGD